MQFFSRPDIYWSVRRLFAWKGCGIMDEVKLPVSEPDLTLLPGDVDDLIFREPDWYISER